MLMGMQAKLEVVAMAVMDGVTMFCRKARRPSLRQRVKDAAVFRGKTYREVMGKMGAAQTIIQQTDGRTLRTWQEDDYSISLLFDAQELCLGVEDEHY